MHAQAKAAERVARMKAEAEERRRRDDDARESAAPPLKESSFSRSGLRYNAGI